MIEIDHFAPLHDRVLVKVTKKAYDGMIVIPESVDQRKLFRNDGSYVAYQGEVLKTGPGRADDNGDFQPISVKAGDLVRFTAYDDSNNLFGDDICLITERDIWFVETNGAVKTKLATARQ